MSLILSPIAAAPPPSLNSDHERPARWRKWAANDSEKSSKGPVLAYSDAKAESFAFKYSQPSSVSLRM